MKITVKRFANGDIQLSDGAMGLVMSKDDAFDMAGEILAYDRERAFIKAMDEHSFDDPPTKTVTAPRTCATCKWFTKDHDTGFKGLCRRFPKEETKYDYNHCGEWGAK